jgi:hypothetical protein
MEQFAGLDVSINETSVCVVTDNGDVMLEISVATDPAEIADALSYFAGRLRRVGHEAGSLSPWLQSELVAAGVPKAGDPDVRRALYEAASAMLRRFKGRDILKSWGLKLAKTKCHAKARVAVARKLAVVMNAIGRDGTSYVGDPTASAQDVAAWATAKEKRLS